MSQGANPLIELPSVSELKRRLKDAKEELQSLKGSKADDARREELKLIITGLQRQIRRIERGRWIHRG